MAQLIGALGAAAVIWGSWLAWCQPRLKQVVAYSSVAQIGYLFLLFPLTYGVDASVSLQAQQGITLQVISHALAKSAMFLAAGNLILAVGNNRVGCIGGCQPLSAVFTVFLWSGRRLPDGAAAFGWFCGQVDAATGQYGVGPVVVDTGAGGGRPAVGGLCVSHLSRIVSGKG